MFFSVHVHIMELEHLPFRIHFQSELFLQIPSNCLLHPMQLALVPAKYHHVVHISKISFCAQLFLDIMIQSCQVKVSKPLTRIKPNRHAYFRPVRVHDCIQHLQEPLIVNHSGEHRLELVVRNAVKELMNIHFQAVSATLWILPDKLLNTFLPTLRLFVARALRRASVRHAAIAVLIHRCHENGFQHVDHHVMNHLLPHARDIYEALLPAHAIVYFLWLVRIIPEIGCVVHQFILQRNRVYSVIMRFFMFPFLSSLVLCRVVHSEEIIVFGNILFVQMVIRLHVSLPPLE